MKYFLLDVKQQSINQLINTNKLISMLYYLLIECGLFITINLDLFVDTADNMHSNPVYIFLYCFSLLVFFLSAKLCFPYISFVNKLID